jgi:uncharacterized protein YneF (UPF0154 family)
VLARYVLQSHGPSVTWEDVKVLAERMAEYPSQKRIEEWLTEVGVEVRDDGEV